MPQALPAVIAFLGSTAVTVAGVSISWGTVLLTTTSLASGLIMSGKKPRVDVGAAGRNLGISVDANAPRKKVYGKAGVSGDRIFVDCYSSNQKLGQVLALSVGAISGITGYYFDESVLTLSGGVVQTAPWTDKVQFQVKSGTDDKTAHTDLVSGSTVWTTAHRGRGVTDVFFEATYDQRAFSAGFPTPRFVGDFALVYDPRLDSTNGGSGSHRIADPTTWGFSRSGPLHALDFCLGNYQNGKRIWGLGIPASLIDFASFAAAATICEADISGKPRFTTGGRLSDDDDPRATLDAIAASFGGAIFQSGGLIRCLAAAPVTATVTLTDDDLDGGIEYVGNQSWRDSVNSVRVAFTDPARDWETNTTAPITDAAYVTEDGGETLEEEYPAHLCEDADAAHRLGRLRLANAREPRTIRAKWKRKAFKLREGMTVNLASTRFSISEKMLVIERALQPNGTVLLTLRTETDAKYTAMDAFTQAMPTFARTNRYDPAVVATPDGGDWSAAGATHENAAGVQLPYIRVTGAVTDPLVRTAIIEYRETGASEWTQLEEIPAGASIFTDVPALLTETNYDIAVSYRNMRGVVGSRLVITPVQTPPYYTSNDTRNVGGVPSLTVLREVERLAARTAGLAAAFEQAREVQISDDRAVVTFSQRLYAENQSAIAAIAVDYITSAGLGAAFASYTLTLEASYFDPIDTRLDTAEGNISTNAAAISTEATARATADGALARRIDAMTAQMAGAFASIQQSQQVFVSDNRASTEATLRFLSEVRGAVAVIEADYTTGADLTGAFTNYGLTSTSTFTDLAGRVDDAETAISTNAAAISTEASTRASEDAALASLITNLNAEVDDNTAGLATELTTRATADSALARLADRLTSRVAGALASIDQTRETISTDNRALARIFDQVVASQGGLQALVSILAEALVDTTDPDNPVARALFEVLVEASGGDPAILRLVSGDGGSEAVIAAAKIVLRNMGAGENEDQTVMEASGGFAFFSRPVSIDDGAATPTRRLIIGPGTGWVLWYGAVDKTPATATTANAEWYVGADGTIGFANYALPRIGSGAPTATALGQYLDSVDKTLWFDTGSEVFRLTPDLETAASATALRDETFDEVVALVHFPSVNVRDHFVCTYAEAFYSSPDNATGADVVAQWACYAIRDDSGTAVSIGDNAAVAGTARSRIWPHTGETRNVTFQDTGNITVAADALQTIFLNSGTRLDWYASNDGGTTFVGGVTFALTLKKTAGSGGVNVHADTTFTMRLGG